MDHTTHQPVRKSLMKETPWVIYEEDGRPWRIKAEYGLHFISGNQDAYFSVTGETQQGFRIDKALIHWKRDSGSGGCIHEEIGQHFPELKPLIDLHLSGSDGAPTHAEANAWFWFREFLDSQPWAYTASSRPWYCRDKAPDPRAWAHFLSHCRIDEQEGQRLLARVRVELEKVSHYSRVYEGGTVAVAKAFVENFVRSQRPRWYAEAQAAIKQFGLHD